MTSTGERADGEDVSNLACGPKVAVLLPQRASVQAIARAGTFIRCLLQAHDLNGRNPSIVLGLPGAASANRRAIERRLAEELPGVIVRSLQWEQVPVGNARRMYPDLDPALDLEGIETIVIPRDWGWNYLDCDFWISFADLETGAILPLRPTGHYCRDLAVRYAPHAYAESIHAPYWGQQTDAFRIWRQSALVMASDVGTIEDLVSYAGVRRERTMLVPSFSDPFTEADQIETSVERNSDKLAWWPYGCGPDDILAAAEGLQMYQDEGGSLRPVLIREAGDDVQQVMLDRALALASRAQKAYLQELPQQVYRSQASFVRILHNAAVFWSSSIAGGDGEAVVAAARTGTRFLGFDHAVNAAAASAFGTAAVLYDGTQPEKIAEALHLIEQTAEQRPAVAVQLSFEAVEACGYLLDRLQEARRD